MARQPEWTVDEYRACVRAYLQLMKAQRSGKRINKSELCKKVVAAYLPKRNHDAYGRRMHNISAMVESLGFQRVQGYVPGWHVGPRPAETIKRLLIEEGLLRIGTARPLESHLEVEKASEALLGAAGKSLLRNPPAGNKMPTVVRSRVTVVQRDASVRAWALENANGVCEGCENPAPFFTTSGRPYLEVHHVVRLKDGGPDTTDNTVAVCPTCHMRLHHGKDRVAFARRMAKRLVRVATIEVSAE